ncbi:hypothetical protein D9M72_382970 [compost metagenome]
MPLIVTALVSLLLTVAPPPVPTVSLPLETESVVVTLVLSTSATETPPMAVAVFELTVCALGTPFTGASLTGVMSRLAVPATLPPLPSSIV